MRPLLGLFLAAGTAGLMACATPPGPLPPSPAATIGLSDAMIQTVDALAAARAHAARQGQRGLQACGAEAVFHIMTVPVTGPGGTQVAHLVLAPPETHDGPHSSTVTLTLSGDDCDAPQPPPARRR